MTKVAFITGITGQDGSYLAELLLEKKYFVHGLIRRSSLINTSRIDHIFSNKNLTLHYGDVTDGACLYSSLANIKNLYHNMTVLEIYNLAAQSHVGVSFNQPEYTANVNALGTLRILEAMRSIKSLKKSKLYQASSSEMFGDTKIKPQNEKTIFKL